MSAPQAASTMIEGRVVHEVNNALKITFSAGPGDRLATGVQGAGNSLGAKAAILLGFKTGGAGKHRITYADGSVVWVESKDAAPTVLSRGDGTVLGTVQRADTSTAVGSTAGTLFHFVPDPEEARTPELFRLVLLDRMGVQVGRLDVVRKVGGWTSRRFVDDLHNEPFWWDQAGQPLPVPILGTRLWVKHPLDPVERDVLLGVCVDIGLGLRPYIAVMKEETGFRNSRLFARESRKPGLSRRP
ncbi:hypothetical protein [Nocardia aurantiaca]|uniref:Uncharacterized protein n=1 Tax=Nocardia aurantiaca TaxID=2675850 RepID=A0A6I3L164_9NOCA|nr:hypothetical protein [Nocardia aurantiaca]MTE13589.1 hypothetical protein [Nocardia aurantiaca]